VRWRMNLKDRKYGRGSSKIKNENHSVAVSEWFKEFDSSSNGK
jgi:hypothetical protein